MRQYIYRYLFLSLLLTAFRLTQFSVLSIPQFLSPSTLPNPPLLKQNPQISLSLPHKSSNKLPESSYSWKRGIQRISRKTSLVLLFFVLFGNNLVFLFPALTPHTSHIPHQKALFNSRPNVGKIASPGSVAFEVRVETGHTWVGGVRLWLWFFRYPSLVSYMAYPKYSIPIITIRHSPLP